MEGKGKLTITGKLGDVMQESAQAAMSYIRSRAHLFGLPRDFYRNLDVHIHIPEGAIPKDGPSAGITLATTICSALTRIPVRGDVAMTGEITLRGKVLPIGGLKEKLMAAHRHGIMEAIMPRENEKDLPDIPEAIKQTMKLTFRGFDGRSAEDRAGAGDWWRCRCRRECPAVESATGGREAGALRQFQGRSASRRRLRRIQLDDRPDEF